jgi:transcriptional regulator of acetoin/glycerol metabolism
MNVILELWSRLVPDLALPREVLDRLAAYDWPGNYRQLAGVLRSLQVIVTHGESVSVDDLPAEMRLVERAAPHSDTLTSVELEAMRAALDACGGNVSAAARRLGVSRSTLYRRKLLGD